MLRSYSVIVPVLNEQDGIGRTLHSIAESMAFLEVHHPRASEISGEIVVVDDGSTEDTVGRVREFARYESRVRVVQHQCSLGIGPARNTGVRMSAGEALFFCDGDDRYLAEHLFVGFSMLDHSATAPTPERTLLRVGNRGHIFLSGREPLAAVRTGVRLFDPIHPFWRRRIINTVAQNLCVRRECHEWGEGFPEAAVYKRIGGCEDVAYNCWLNTFFRVGVIPIETVEYARSPGNSFDRQLTRFMNAPDPTLESATPHERALHDLRFRLEGERIAYLLDKWRVLGPPPLAALVNWEGVARALLGRALPRFAAAVADQAANVGRPISVALAADIRKACESASALHGDDAEA